MDIPQGLYDYITTKLTSINELSTANQEKLLDSAVIKTYEPGSYVFRQNDTDDNVHYLLVGKLEMMAVDETTFAIEAGSEKSFLPLDQIKPRKYSARVIGAVQTLIVSISLLESLLGSEKTNSSLLTDAHDDLDSSYNWMTHLLESKIFSSIPPENIQQIFAIFEEVAVSKDELIVKQGEPGDYYYIIQVGEFKVSRHLEKQNKTFDLATLQGGDGFGEEALLGDAPRNASVVAMTDGTLMRITKDAFLNLIRDPVINTVSYEEALQLINDGSIWVDVRFPDEYKCSSMTDSLNLPLYVIRVQMNKLNLESNYVVYCDNGTRSAIAAYLLFNNGYTVSYLKDGIAEHLGQPDSESKLDETKPSAKEIKNSEKEEHELITNKGAFESKMSTLTDTEEMVQLIMAQETDMDALSKALSTVMASLFKQLEEALNEKAKAEIGRCIAEQKLEILQKQKK